MISKKNDKEPEICCHYRSGKFRSGETDEYQTSGSLCAEGSLMLILPEEHRKLFQEPFGELYPDLDEIVPKIADSIIYAVGDVVTHNLQKRGITPAIAVVGGFTMRLPCKKLPVFQGECIRVKNPAGTLTDDLIRALKHAIRYPPVTVIVDGEEDLAVIPLVIAAPDGAVVLYGQPHKGVVLRTVARPSANKSATWSTTFAIAR